MPGRPARSERRVVGPYGGESRSNPTLDAGYRTLRARGARRVRRRRRRVGRRQLARSTRTTRATRADARAGARGRRTHPGAIRPAVLPRSARTPGPAGLEHHAVVMAVIAVLANAHDHGPGKEHGGEDENDSGDDHHPSCGHIEPGRLYWLVCRGRWRSSRGGGRRTRWGLGWVAHPLNTAPDPNRHHTIRRQKLL